MKTIYLIFFAAYLTAEVFPQACCSAGTPILGSLETSTTQKNSLQLSFSYDFNLLQSVYEGSIKLDDNLRERITHSSLFEFSYGFTDKFTFTSLFTFANQRRTVTSISGSKNLISSFGVGDAVVLFKYELISQTLLDQNQLAVGVGPKIPLGQSDKTANGILLPADIQPGSGSWDIIFWAFYSHGFMPSIPLNFFVTSSYKINSENKRFANSEAGYKFGNEFVSTIGVGYRTDLFFDASLSFRFRTTTNDKFDNENVPNTGGYWLYLIPGINMKIIDQLTLRLAAQVPLYRYLKGTQLTTTYSVSGSFFYNFSL
ncbi:MAG: hypothetical protein IPJ03_21985 [Ignavibacteriales bacterium]|nr:hypothetical protein [Ignavibacteriales bacterium]